MVIGSNLIHIVLDKWEAQQLLIQLKRLKEKTQGSLVSGFIEQYRLVSDLITGLRTELEREQEER